MPCSGSIPVELAPEAGLVEWEQAVLEAGRAAMRQALGQAVRAYEDAHTACPGCGREHSQSQGTVPRRVLTRCGGVRLALRRQRGGPGQRRLRPAQGCLAGGAGGR